MDRKILEKVFDKQTLLSIYDLFNRGVFREFGGPIADGKEARVFSASNDHKLAVKIYKAETTAFESLKEYIKGDPRFWHIGGNQRALLRVWVKKEFGNLNRMFRAGISCPKPFAFRKNVLVMEFIGEKIAAPQLKEVKLKNPETTFHEIIEDIRKMYQIAKLVHADLSEYNILFYKNKHVIIDVAQSVDLRHPLANTYLERDVQNICNFFSKLIETNPKEIKEYIQKEL